VTSDRGVTNRPALTVVSSDFCVPALEALALVAEEYGLPGLQKPCVAMLLDGNIGGAARHEASFIIALECRALGLSERETDRVLVRWAKKIGYSQRDATRPIRNAYAKTAGGEFKYHAPGVIKKEGTIAYNVLLPICVDVGCPANCPAYRGVHRGPRGESIERFERLLWPEWLRRDRHAAAVEYYRAIWQLERDRGFAAGAEIRTSTRQLAELAGRDRSHALDNLRILYTRGLLARFERGSGSGPHAYDRRPTVVARAVPIPHPSQRLLPQYKPGGRSRPEIGGDRPSQMEGASRPNMGGGT
jgi:hypothetical protein